MVEESYCISCKTSLVNDASSSSFKCPNCLKYELKRCSNCRKIATKYTCPECGFVGPN